MSKAFYLKSEDIPDERVDAQRGMICQGIEKVIGKGKLKAAQKLGRKWILNAIDEESRIRIVTAGRVEVGRVAVAVYATDPFAVLGPDGRERQTTKLVIDGVPLQEGEEKIKSRLEELGVMFCTSNPIKLENHYDVETKRFSELLTGRRFAYIVLPEKELPKVIKIGPYMARLYYKEMMKELPSCRNCKQKGHWTNQCPTPKLCYDCNQPGHKKGDEACPFIQSVFKEGDEMEEEDESTDDSESEPENGYESCNENAREDKENEQTEKENIIEQSTKNIDTTVLKTVVEHQNSEPSEKATNNCEDNKTKSDSCENSQKNEEDTAKKTDIRGRTQSSMEEFVNRMRSGSRKRDRSPQQNVGKGKEKVGNKKAKKSKNDKKKDKSKR